MNYQNLYMILIVLFSSGIIAQNTLPSKTTAYVNFNVGASEIIPQEKYKQQGVTLLGCNTIISNKDIEY